MNEALESIGAGWFNPTGVTLEDQPVEPSWVRRGTPVARAKELIAAPDGRLTVGVWDCTAGEFDWTHYSDEIVHILEGEVTVAWSGDVRTLRPGDVAYFEAGTTTRWNVERYVKKVFVLRAQSRPRRIFERVKRLVRRG